LLERGKFCDKIIILIKKKKLMKKILVFIKLRWHIIY